MAWDFQSIDVYTSPMTRLAVLYLAVSALCFFILTIRFVAKRLRFSGPATITNLRNWSRMTTLVLVLYGVTEFGNAFRGISVSKMTGISALAGGLSNMCIIASGYVWLLLALAATYWIASRQLASESGSERK
jgi:hypothetical protein